MPRACGVCVCVCGKQQRNRCVWRLGPVDVQRWAGMSSAGVECLNLPLHLMLVRACLHLHTFTLITGGILSRITLPGARLSRKHSPRVCPPPPRQRWWSFAGQLDRRAARCSSVDRHPPLLDASFTVTFSQCWHREAEISFRLLQSRRGTVLT